MAHKTLPGGAIQVEGDKRRAPVRKHKRVRRVSFDSATGPGKGGMMTVEHENPTGEYPNPHGDMQQVYTGDHDDFHQNVVPKLAKALRIGGAPGAAPAEPEPDADDE